MIKLIKSTFYHEEKTKEELTAFIMSAEKLSFGNECEKFEKNFAHWQGRNHAVFFNSGSSANLALIQALLNLGRIKKGDIAAFSAVTWSTNVMPFLELGLEVVPVDVELETLNVSSRTLIDCIKANPVKVLFLTNLLGFCDDIDEIKKICERESVLLLEDNCEALGTVYKGEKLGNFGVASTFSFFVGHHMSTIEGGMVCTNDNEIAVMLRIVRAHGWDRNLGEKEQEELARRFGINSLFYARYTFYDLGYNLRPTEISGFLGNVQLRYIDEILKKRNANFMQLAPVLYTKEDYYYPVRFNHIDFLSNFAIPLVTKSKEIQDNLVKRCEGIVEIRPMVGGDITKHPFFQKHARQRNDTFAGSNATLIYNQGLYIGNNPELTEEEVSQILHVFS